MMASTFFSGCFSAEESIKSAETRQDVRLTLRINYRDSVDMRLGEEAE